MSTECATDKVEIIQGEDKTFYVKLTDEITGDVFDLTNATAIKAIFKGTTSNVEVTQAASEIAIVTPAVNGKIEITVSDTKTAQMLVGARLPIEIEITETTDVTIVQILKQLTVTARI